jgi:hypothetical protein
MLWNRRRWIGMVLLAAPLGSGIAWLSPDRSAATDGPIKLEVSLSARELRVVEHGSTVATYGVAVGRRGHRTPTGTFRTGEIVWNPNSRHQQLGVDR